MRSAILPAEARWTLGNCTKYQMNYSSLWSVQYVKNISEIPKSLTAAMYFVSSVLKTIYSKALAIFHHVPSVRDP